MKFSETKPPDQDQHTVNYIETGRTDIEKAGIMSVSKYAIPLGVIGFSLGVTSLLGCCTVYSDVAIIAAVVAVCYLKQYMAGGWYYGDETISGKTVVVTGANTGIGKETAKDLAKRGGRIIMACRDMTKGEQARKEIIDETGNQKVVLKKLDLASFDSIRAFSKDFNATEDRLDILINNAGVMMCPKMLTEDGLEMQTGVNHFGHFLLTNLLLDKLKASAPSRIINVSSMGHMFGKINFDDLNGEKSYKRNDAYGQSKLANLLHVLELTKRLEGTGVTANGLHPGVVETELTRFITFFHWPVVQALVYPFRAILMKTPLQGAQTTLRLALDPALETVSGKYFSDCKEKKPGAHALDESVAKRLWDVSEEVTKAK